MQDRVPLYPGRVTLTPVSGQANTYDLTRADQPTQEGTPLNKASLLKDTTAALFGLGTGAVPDDVLAALGKYKQYWWRRRTHVVSSHYVGNVTTVSWSATQFKITYKAKRTIYYADSYTVNPTTGAITLDNQQSVTCSDDGSFYEANPSSLLLGKWCLNLYEKPSEVVYIPVGADIKESSNSSGETTVYLYRIGSYQKVDATFVENVEIGDWVYVQSSSRSAYPDSGTSGGYGYEYLGIPLDNAVTAPKIATGSYTGTGTYGSSNPNSLTFEFVPKLVFIHNSSDGRFRMCVINGDSECVSAIVGSSQYVVKTAWENKKLSWYNSDSATKQLNESGVVYNYVAIG